MSQPRSLFSHEVADLCLGKPPLHSVSVSATVGEALSGLKSLGEAFLSVWTCNHANEKDDVIEEEEKGCRCVGKICMLDVIAYLGRYENIMSPVKALEAPVRILIHGDPATCLVRHLEPHASLVEAMDLIVEGAQNLVIPLESRHRNEAISRRKLLNCNSSGNPTVHNNREYCWLTQEDIVRYLLNSIGYFSHVSNHPIDTLNVIDSIDTLAVHYDDPASAALPLISRSLVQQTSVAILDDEDKVIGEISPYTLNTFHESVAAAIVTLSAGELMAYIDCGGPTDELVQLVKDRLQEKKYEGLSDMMEEDFTLSSSSSSSASSTSSDEEFGQGRSWRLGGYSARLVRRSEAIVCYPWSSLVAVMVQALSHRVSYVWVVEDDRTLCGIVTFASMFKVFRERPRFMA